MNLVLQILFGSLLAVCTIAEVPIIEGRTLSVRQINEPGFGDETNQYAFAMAVFRGSIYIATLNAVNRIPKLDMALFFLGEKFHTHGTNIYKGTVDENGDYKWEKVLENGKGDETNYGVRNLKVIGDYLYAVTCNHVNGFSIWRSKDGSVWETVMEHGFGDKNNKSGRGLIEYDGYLYVGIENRDSGSKIFRRQLDDKGDFAKGKDWEMITDDGAGNSWNWWFSDFQIYNNHLYVGTLNPTGFQLLRSKNGKNFEKLIEHGGSDSSIGSDSSAMTLYVFNNKLYIGTMNFLKGASLWHNTDKEGKKFESVFTGGNDNWFNKYVWKMQEHKGRLYVGTFSGPSQFSLFSSSNPGTDAWVIETDNGFDNHEQYGIRTMAVFNDKLIIGGATAVKHNGCKVFEGTFIDMHYENAQEAEKAKGEL